MSCSEPPKWGSSADFASLYENFLDTVYRPNGRSEVVKTVSDGLRKRGVKRVLDCAAGTGFPGLDLVANSSLGLDLQCTDISAEMLEVLSIRAKELGIALDQLAPEIATEAGPSRSYLQLGWDDLDRIPAVYDYVMCRGNSLVYANTWSGGKQVADPDAIAHYLEKMAGRIRPGGYLHVDAPWNLALPPARYRPLSYGDNSIWEQVRIEPNRRRWRVTIRKPIGETIKFERFSTLITIHDVEAMLRPLGFEQTKPFQLDGERRTLGVIIARKGHGPPSR